MEINKPRDIVSRLRRAVPEGAWLRLGIALGGFTIATGLFALIAEDVRNHETTAFDDAILNAIHSAASPQLDMFMKIVTNFGGVVAVLAIMAGLVSLLVMKRRWRMAAFLVGSIGGAAALNVLVKAFFQRTRPDLWTHLVVENGYSFPSGHSMVSMALAAAVVIIAWRTRRYPVLVTIGAVIYVILIGVSRMYLGVHFPTDIFAGWCLSIAWVLVTASVLAYLPRRHKAIAD